MTRFLFRVMLIGLAFAAGPIHARCADFVPQAKPQNASRDIVGQDLDTIQERGWIEFAVYEDFPPYSFGTRETPQGVDIEIGRIIAADLGVEARFKFVEAGESLDADLRNWVWKGPIVGGSVANVMLRVPYDSEFACRVEQVVFTGQYAGESIAIAYDKASYPDEKPVPAYFRFDSVAVENDSIADFYLTSLAGGQLNANIRRFPTMAEAVKALAGGEVMAAMGPKAQLEHGVTEAIGVHEPSLPGFSVGAWTIGLGVNFRYRPLAYAVDDAVRYALDDGRIAGIYERYGLSFTAPER
ncbi:MAG: transporter substrate-binding domain-containing protein [Rhodobacter sp.]|nr:transporter substrate-binding domain-containing protein [Rhodobacter sp.]